MWGRGFTGKEDLDIDKLVRDPGRGCQAESEYKPGVGKKGKGDCIFGGCSEGMKQMAGHRWFQAQKAKRHSTDRCLR